AAGFAIRKSGSERKGFRIRRCSFEKSQLQCFRKLSRGSGGRLIYIVDDHADSAEALVRLLARRGQAARALTCGRELFEALAGAQRPRLIVLDLMMPGEDGLDCLAKLTRE